MNKVNKKYNTIWVMNSFKRSNSIPEIMKTDSRPKTFLFSKMNNNPRTNLKWEGPF